MDDFELGKLMYGKVVDFINKRYPKGWGGCAIMYTEDGQFLISVAIESYNDAACLCMETGAMCEAQKYNLKITHSINQAEVPSRYLCLSSYSSLQLFWSIILSIWSGNERKIIV